ncbi:eukaryotic translation initiation factor 4b/4h [Anaeramoeba flamelloides]|uniref:Eukaryotic translation initiation factor 4b/4h n=1 Tax=Anaeramoeba flamelloides TaxID=1746091 RepID=A0AAV7YVP9_9EUKA|nr:eukaryotic translation initiation factor 4b/4h [Anaeramoeba flamelloides]
MSQLETKNTKKEDKKEIEKDSNTIKQGNKEEKKEIKNKKKSKKTINKRENEKEIEIENENEKEKEKEEIQNTQTQINDNTETLPKKKLYVGNISFSSTEKSLSRSFGKFGTIVSTNIVRREGRSLGYGFIEMSTKEEAVTAIKELNQTVVDGREIIVEFADPTKSKKRKNFGYRNNRFNNYQTRQGFYQNRITPYNTLPFYYSEYPNYGVYDERYQMGLCYTTPYQGGFYPNEYQTYPSYNQNMNNENQQNFQNYNDNQQTEMNESKSTDLNIGKESTNQNLQKTQTSNNKTINQTNKNKNQKNNSDNNQENENSNTNENEQINQNENNFNPNMNMNQSMNVNTMPYYYRFIQNQIPFTNYGIPRRVYYPPRNNRGYKKQQRNYNQKKKLSENSIFITNLPYSMTANDLLKTFEKYNPKKSRIVIGDFRKPRGFGFVEFENQQIRDKALELNETTVGGRTIYLKIAYEQNEKNDEEKI